MSLMYLWQLHLMRSLSDSTFVRMLWQNSWLIRKGVDLRLYKVIYQAIEDVEAAMKVCLIRYTRQKVIGHAEVRQLFKASGVGTIAGSYVLDGNFPEKLQGTYYT